MTKRRKSKNSETDDVKAYRHETETKKNAIPVGLASYDTLTSKPKKYEYDPHLDNIKQQFLTANNQGMNLHITLPEPANRSRVVRGNY